MKDEWKLTFRIHHHHNALHFYGYILQYKRTCVPHVPFLSREKSPMMPFLLEPPFLVSQAASLPLPSFSLYSWKACIIKWSEGFLQPQRSPNSGVSSWEKSHLAALGISPGKNKPPAGWDISWQNHWDISMENKRSNALLLRWKRPNCEFVLPDFWG